MLPAGSRRATAAATATSTSTAATLAVAATRLPATCRCMINCRVKLPCGIGLHPFNCIRCGCNIQTIYPQDKQQQVAMPSPTVMATPTKSAMRFETWLATLGVDVDLLCLAKSFCESLSNSFHQQSCFFYCCMSV